MLDALRYPRLLALLALGAVACDDNNNPPVTTDAGSDGGSTLPDGCDRAVTPGADDQTSVQAMFEAAADGDVLCFTPGTYEFTDPIEIRDLTGVTIRGTTDDRDDVVLDFSAQTGGADGLNAVAMTDFTIESFTVLDATGNDVFITGGNGVTIRNIRAGWVTRPMEMRGKYSLYPVQSTDVLIEDSEAFGSSDAGIYVGQVTNCIVRNSVATENVAGIEIENSTNCEVVGNNAHGNTGGILVFELPGLDQHGSGTLVHDNDVVDNNLANFAEAGTIVSILPQGTGIMILSAHDVEVRDNTVTGNDSAGVIVVSYETLIQADLQPNPDDPEYDTFIEGIWIHANTFSDNGTMPSGILAAIGVMLGIDTFTDVVWDGTQRPSPPANDFCFMPPGTYTDADLLAATPAPTMDPSAVNCSRTPRPPVML